MVETKVALRGRRSGRVRIEDVAKKAGVSPITVSRALRRPEMVSEESRAIVVKAMREIGYVPDLIAGSLASNRTRIIAVVVSTLESSVFAEPIDAIQETIGADGYHVLVANSGYAETKEEAMIAALLGRRPEGIILIGVTHTRTARDALKAARIPIIEMWDLTDRPLDIVIGFSNFEAGRRLVHDLIEDGYKHIAHVTTGARADSRAAARNRGYQAALAEAGLGPPWVIEVERVQSYEGGRTAIAQLLAADRPLDAVFFANDVLAAGALFECQARGIPVPRRLALAGFGDAELSRHLTPALTSVGVPRYEIGQKAAQLLLSRIRGEKIAKRIFDLGFTVIRRASA